VVAREHVVLNPYYQHMGGLYGSEYWTYILPRRVGHEVAARLTRAPFKAVGTLEAIELGLLDDCFGEDLADFRTQVCGLAERLARDPALDSYLAEKRAARAYDEALMPLAAYREAELARSHECFFGPDRSYHEARRRFVYKLGAPCAVTPPGAPIAAFTATGRSTGR
jgi:putative two-component system protein, hydrogenase maturation factor HypX/HoxX